MYDNGGYIVKDNYEETSFKSQFYVEDIHKIREYHYEMTKDMSIQEKLNFYNEGGRAFLAEMEKRKLQKA